jgi:SAM-dependent methyltransferase
MSLNREVIDANIAVHSRLAADYQTCEPHFRPENVAKVRRRLAALVEETRATDLLDLGCGTGFVIDIARTLVRRIVGVDVTPAMLARVNVSGPAAVVLIEGDTGEYSPVPGAFQLVTAYSFLHHLADIRPTLHTASSALAPGGKFYADLEPNFYFWEAIRAVDADLPLTPVVKREVDAVLARGVEVQAQFGVTSDVFDRAEFGKNILGGFKEDILRELLESAGFSDVTFHYEWFLGEGHLINSGTAARSDLLTQAALVDNVLRQALPVSRHLFKYIGFVATK